jgi:hypothetical protein
MLDNSEQSVPQFNPPILQTQIILLLEGENSMDHSKAGAVEFAEGRKRSIKKQKQQQRNACFVRAFGRGRPHLHRSTLKFLFKLDFKK